MKTHNWDDLATAYHQMITTEFSGLNLTAHKSKTEILEKQVLDSISPFAQIPKILGLAKSCEYIVDLGTGGGFPLIPVAKLFPDKICVGVDARDKKLRAVKYIAERLNLENIRVIHSNFQDLYFDAENILFLVKAVGKTSDVLGQIYSKFDADILFYKGANFYELEIEEMNKLKNNEQLQNIYEANVAGVDKRHIVHCVLGKKVPRGTKQVKLFKDQL